VSRPLSPAELFPVGRPDISVRNVTLSTGVTLRVLESGPPHGEPVVMLHGWGASAYMFRQALTLLPTRGLRAIAVDLRGHGLSDKPAESGAYTLGAYCADVDGLLDMLELTRAALIGQSMGGGLALHCALRNPDRVSGLVLVNPVGLVSIDYLSMLRLLPQAFFATMDGRLAPRFVVELILRYVAYADPTQPTQRDVDEYWAPTQLPGFIGAARAALSEFDWRPLSDGDARALTVPTVVILGTRDRLIRNAVSGAARLNGAVVRSVSGGHCVLEENPATVYQIAGDFLAGN
jgi:pimeloyl-ACP methyl ester carboxylesterase